MQIPEKPKTPEEQISVLWDLVTNHIVHGLEGVTLKLNFVLVFLGLVLGFLAICVASLGIP